MLRTCLPFACALLLTSHAGADNWPRFRGPNGAGTAADSTIPVTWDEKNNVAWKLAVPGLGNSSPAVWGDRLFLQTAGRDGKGRSVLAVSVKDGKVLWERTFAGKPVAKKKVHEKNTLASASPATDGERVYAAVWDGSEVTLHALTVDGKPLWERNLGTFTSQHGPGASPVVYRDKVILSNDQDVKSTLHAFDARSGETVWEKERPFYRACYSAPFLRDAPGGRPELVLVSTKGITAYDPDNGRENWTYQWKFSAKMPLRTTGSPAFTDDMLFAVSGDGGGDRHMIALKLNGKEPQGAPTLAWENKKDFPYVPSPLVRGEHIYFVNDKGLAGCYEQKTGKRVWLERLDNTTFVSSPVLIDGKVYAASEDGDVFVFAAEPKYRLLARNALGEAIRATPAVADGRLFIRTQSHLYCIAKR